MLLYLVILGSVLSMLMRLFTQPGNTIPYSSVVSMFRQEEVKSFRVDGDTLTMELYTPYNGNSRVTTTIADVDRFRTEMQELFAQQSASGVLQSYDFVAEASPSAYDLVLPLLLVGLILLVAWVFIMNRVNGNNPMANFGKARTVLGVPNNK